MNESLLVVGTILLGVDKLFDDVIDLGIDFLHALIFLWDDSTVLLFPLALVFVGGGGRLFIFEICLI